MKIGIITFHAAYNYGSMLQAYALQSYLKSIGHYVEIINFRPLTQKALYSSIFNVFHLRNIRDLVLRLLLDPSTIKPICSKRKLFQKFLKEKLNLTVEYNHIEELARVNFDYDILITGSDQIWNTNAYDFSEAYFASFISDKIRKVAYAPSMGPNPENQDVVYLKRMLLGYHAVSVREKRTKLFLENNGIVKNVQLVLDPTMLLSAEDYLSMVDSRPLIEGKYIYYYTPGPKPRHEFLALVDWLGEKLGLDVICDYPFLFCKKYKHLKYYPQVGPLEFLNLVKNAEVVCGASFHLMVFAILFQKNFYCLNGDVDSRMNNLMKTFQLENRIWSLTTTPSRVLENCSQSIDYLKVFSNLQTKKKESENFLYEALKS